MPEIPEVQSKPGLVAANRRAFPRVSSRCLVDYRPVGEDPMFQALQQSAKGLLQNISGGGVCVRMRKDPGAGAMLALNIQLPGLPTSVIALGKVCWTEASDDGETDVGIEFWWIGWHDQSAQESIRNFISDRLEPGAPADPGGSPPSNVS